MTLQAVARRLPTAALTGAVVGALLSGGAVHAIDTAAAEPAPCVVPASPGAYICTVVVAAPESPGPTPEPSVVESASPPPPTPTPSPTATPTAGPSPTPTPTVAPSGVNAVYLPGSIDATGKTDVTAALNAFLNGVAPGSTVEFGPGGTYRLSSALLINSGRRNVTFEGNGATLQMTGSGTNENYSIWYLKPGNQGLVIRDFILAGNDPTPTTFTAGKEGAMGVLVDGASNTLITNVTVRGVWGDAVEVNSNAGGTRVTASTIESAGRNALSIIWGHDTEFDHNTITAVGYVVYDMEPNTASEPVANVSIHDNASGAYSDLWFAVNGSAVGAAFSGISVVNNTSIAPLTAWVNLNGPGRVAGVALTGNRTAATVRGPAMRFAHVDGLIVTGNVQPLTSGSLLSLTDCPGAVHQ